MTDYIISQYKVLKPCFQKIILFECIVLKNGKFGLGAKLEFFKEENTLIQLKDHIKRQKKIEKIISIKKKNSRNKISVNALRNNINLLLENKFIFFYPFTPFIKLPS